MDIIKLTKELGLISIPGALTPSEVMTAYNAGADLIKLFPITKDDIDYVIGITRPLSHIPFICVGGTNLDTIEMFIKAGAKGVGTGISILKAELLENNDYDPINGRENNMNIADAIRFADKVGAKKVVPSHFGLFDEIDAQKEINRDNYVIPTPFCKIVL